MTRVITGTATIAATETIVTLWAGQPLTEINCPAGSPVVIEGVANFVKARISTISFELELPHAGAGGAGLATAISAMTPTEVSVGTLNGRTAQVIQQLNVLDANGRGLFYNLIGVTGDNDPGPGRMALNHADPAQVTEIYFDVLDANDGGRDVQALIELWEPGTVLIVRSLASAAYAAFQVTTAAVDATGYLRVQVDAIGADGMLADEPVAVDWRISGAGMQIGAIGPLAERVDYDGEAAGFVYASVNGDGATITTAVLFQRQGATTGVWSAALPFQGFKGDKGDRGWAQVFAAVPDGERRVDRLVAYVGGEGAEPTAGIGLYRGLDGLVADIADATDNRGAPGATGNITGLTPFWQLRVTEDAIGLADQATAEAGLDDELLMTALTTAQAILALSPPSDTSDLEMTVSQLAISLADANNIAQFLGPTGNRVADSFDTLTYVDVAGATNLDTSVPGVLKATTQSPVALLPTMTSGTTGGATISASSFYAATYEAWRAADKNASTLWASANPTLPEWLKVDFGSGKAVGTYTIQVRTGTRATDPKDFTLEGSNDNAVWIELDRRVGEVWTDAQLKTFTVSAAQSFRYYRVHITLAAGGTGGVAIAEMTMLSVAQSNDITVRSTAFVAAATPTKMKALLRVKEVAAAIAGTDFTLECSRDSGTTWAVMALSEMYVAAGLLYVDAAETSVAGQPSGTAPRWRFKTLNNKNVELHDVYLYWS